MYIDFGCLEIFGIMQVSDFTIHEIQENLKEPGKE